MGLVTTLIQYNSIECHYAECRDYLNVMLSVQNVGMLSVVMLSVVLYFVAKCHSLTFRTWID